MCQCPRPCGTARGRRKPAEPVVAVVDVRRREAGVSDDEIHAFVDAMCTDVDTDRDETVAALVEYVRSSAAAGRMTNTSGPDCWGIAEPLARDAALAPAYPPNDPEALY